MNIDDELKLLEQQEAELRNKKLELIRLKAEEENRKKLEQIVEINGSFSIDYNIPKVTLKFDNFRQDVISRFNKYYSKYIDTYGKKIILNLADYQNFKESLDSDIQNETVKNVTIKFDDISARKLNEYVNQPDYDVWDNGRSISIKFAKRGNSNTIYHFFPNAAVVIGKSDVMNINKSDIYRLVDFNQDCINKNLKIKVEYSLLSFAKEQGVNRNKLKELAVLADTSYDVSFASEKYKLQPLQRVGSKFADEGKRVIIADPMGFGKSIEAIAVAKKNNLRTLIVCPAFLVLNWINYIQEYCGEMPYVMEGTTPEQYHFIDLLTNKKQFNIIHYEALSRPIDLNETKNKNSLEYDESLQRNLWVELLNTSKFDLIISDEAHYIKNMDSSRSKAVRQLAAERFIFLTGTPLLNRPMELFPMLNVLRPSDFPSQTAFEKAYCDGKNRVKNVEQLRELLANIMIRRKPVQRLDVNDIPVYFKLSKEAQKRYDLVLDGIYQTVTGGEYDVSNVLAQIIRLKQICSEDKVASTVEQAIEIVDSYEEDEKHNGIIIFSQFKESVYTIAADLKSEGKSVASITGDDSQQERMNIVNHFQDGRYDYLICSYKATSEGLNITRAGTVYHHDLLWNRASHDQATGRAFGRQSDFHGGNSYWGIAKNTIEDWVWELIDIKNITNKAVIEGEDVEYRQESSIANVLIKKIKEGY